MIDAIGGRRVPSWLHEGLAQYFEGDDVQAARRRMRATPGSIPLKQLEARFLGLGRARGADGL